MVGISLYEAVFPWLSGANGGTRTPDRLITNQTHYQLCYVGLALEGVLSP